MSHELLLTAGPPGDAARRRNVLAHAAAAIPGYVCVDIAQTATVGAAIVTTAPTGATVGITRRYGAGAHLVIAASSRIAESVLDGQDGRVLGAEASNAGIRITDDSVTATTDGIGTLPLYWSAHGGMLFVSSHLASLVSLGVPAELDEQGCLEYLAMIHPLDDRTVLEGVRILPPGGLLEWKPDRPPTVDASPLVALREPASSDAAALEEFGEVWRDVIADTLERSSGQRLVVGLSGGLDSRAVLNQIAHLDHRPLTYTYGTSTTRETLVAAEVAHELQCPHLVIPPEPDTQLRNFADIAHLLDGAHSPAEMYELWFSPLLPTFCDVIVNGLAGGPLWGDDKTIGLTDRAAIEAQVMAKYAPLVESVAPYVVGRDRGSVVSVIERSVRESLSKWDVSARADVASFWRVANRQVRWGNMLFSALRRIGIRTEAPFLDRRFVDFANRLSADQRRNGRLYLDAHRTHFPETAGVPRSDDGNAPDALDHVYWSGDRSYLSQLAGLARRHPVGAARRAARRAQAVMAGRLEHGPLSSVSDRSDQRRDAFPSMVWLRGSETYRRRLADVLQEGQPAPGIVDPSMVEQAIHQLRGSGVPASPATLGKVAALGLWVADYERRAVGYRAEFDSVGRGRTTGQ